MYSNSFPKSERYALMESALTRIDGIGAEMAKSIIDLHRTVYTPRFESADGVVGTSLSAALTGAFLASGTAGLVTGISAVAGGTALTCFGIPVALVFAAAGLGLTAYEAVTGGANAYREYKRVSSEKEAVNMAKSAVEAYVANNPYAKHAAESAKRTSEIMLKSGGSLLDKVDAVGKDSAKPQSDPVDTMDDDAFAERFGFTKSLQIVDVDTALAHSLQFYYYMNGMNEYGNKVLDKEAYGEFMEAFEQYWNSHRNFLPYLDEKSAREKMLREFTRVNYRESFLPEFKKKLGEFADEGEKEKTLADLADEGRNEFGDVVDKEKYYSSMGFRPDGRITDMDKFSKAFVSKTGLTLSYNPVSPEGTRLLERMLKDPSGEYLKYLPAPVFLMTEEDRKPYIAKAKDPHRRGESQFGVYGSANARSEQPSANSATNRSVAKNQSGGKADVTDSPDVDKSAGPWHTIGKQKLAEIYKLSPDRSRHLMRLGYVMNIGDGKFYRMSDADRKVMPQIVYDDLDEKSRVDAEKRRKTKLEQGRLSRSDMTEGEIAESNRNAGLPDES